MIPRCSSPKIRHKRTHQYCLAPDAGPNILYLPAVQEDKHWSVWDAIISDLKNKFYWNTKQDREKSGAYINAYFSLTLWKMQPATKPSKFYIIPATWTQRKTLYFVERISSHSHVLYHYVLMGYETIHTIMTTFPPVFGGPVIQKKRSSFLEGQLTWGPTNVVKLCNSFNLLHFWKAEKMGQRWFIRVLNENLTDNYCIPENNVISK